jgi:hypothetical protein
MEKRKAKLVFLMGWHQWEPEDIRKNCVRVNMVEILCIKYVNEKM